MATDYFAMKCKSLGGPEESVVQKVKHAIIMLVSAHN